MENIDGPQSAQQRQIGIFTVGLTFMNWNGWKMKSQDEAVKRDDYFIIFLLRVSEYLASIHRPVPDNIKNIP